MVQERGSGMHSKWLWFAFALVAVLGLTTTANGTVQSMIR